MAEDLHGNVNRLVVACDEAFYMYPRSCSHAVWHVIKHYKPDQPYMLANDLLDFISKSPEWQEVPAAEVGKLANAGDVIVGGLQEPQHGHVIVVYPGAEKSNGGFAFVDKLSGRQIVAKATGTFPLAMSTSMGNWPGSMSKGDKTVRDPWPRKKFERVRFWKYVGCVSNSRSTTTSPKNHRWDTKTIQAVSASPSPKVENRTIGRRWRLEADSAYIGFPYYRDTVTRWQR